MIMRKLKRAVARRRMLADGWTQLNKKRSDGRSAFSHHWKEYLVK